MLWEPQWMSDRACGLPKVKQSQSESVLIVQEAGSKAPCDYFTRGKEEETVSVW
jgi:hypothetical protein